jgi:hypothetical protein
MPAAPMEHKAAGIDRGPVSTRVRRWIYFFPAFSWIRLLLDPPSPGSAFSWIRRSTSRPASRPLLRMRATQVPLLLPEELPPRGR